MVSLRDDQFNAVEVPLFLHESKAGSLRVSREGLYTVFEAELPGSAPELVRLWLHGGGESAYLGVMQPKEGGLRLLRRLTRRELAALPDPVEFASNQEREPDREAEPDAGDLHNEKDEMIKSSETGEETDLHNIEIDNSEPVPANTDGLHKTETDFRSCPWPAEPKGEGLLWYSRPDGSLVAFDGISSLVALPAELRKLPAGAPVREIEGKKYLVFRY